MKSSIRRFEDAITLDYSQRLVNDKYVWEDELEVAELLERDVTAEHELDLVILENSSYIDTLSVTLRADLFRY